MMLTYNMANVQKRSLYAHLYQCIRTDIESGKLPPRTKLPAKRPFAQHLGVSVVTVEGAYSQLVSEGYVEARPRSGFFVAEFPEVVLPKPATQSKSVVQPLPQGSSKIAPSRSFEEAIDLTGSAMPEGWFPLTQWAKCLRETLSREPESQLTRHVGTGGHPRLQQAIADYAYRSRGLRVSPDCIVVGAGAQVLYTYVYELLGATHYAVEDPGYERISLVYERLGAQVSPVALDAQGIGMAPLRESGAAVAHVMPSHQYPTGMVTTAPRRHELLSWAYESPNRYIVEDDYDCDFRMAGRPLPTLQSLDSEGRVVYVNTFSKSMGSGFRLAYLVLPPQLVPVFKQRLGMLSCTVPTIEQVAFARFLESGAFERHVNRRRAACRETRDEILAELGPLLSSGFVRVKNEDAGLSFLLEFATPRLCRAFSEYLERHGVRINPLGKYTLSSQWPEEVIACACVLDYSSVARGQRETLRMILADFARQYAS